ncbi:MAG: hypothetical protein ACXVY5_01995 [Gaiellales bacterium]
MRRRSGLFWAVVAVVVVGALVYVPAYLARASTAPDEPIDFLTHPQAGWEFMFTAVTDLPGARLGSPSAARRAAVRMFSGSPVRPSRVDLMYLPDRVMKLRLAKGTRDLTANAKLVWRVTGRAAVGEPLVTVAVLDFRTGEVIYDVRLAQQ